MTPNEVEAAATAGTVVLDMRLPRVFAKEHILGAVNLQFNRADLADRAEMIFPKDVRFVVHAEPEAIAKLAVDLLKDAGFQVEGYLQGGLNVWKAAALPTARIDVLGVDDLKGHLQQIQAVDARDPFEFKHGHVPGARPLSWTEAWEKASAFTSDLPPAVICGDEVRSALVASILARTRDDVRLVTGGMVDWNERGFAVEKGSESTRT
jgi:rhodanese-related sulfurtransferase